MTQFKVDFNDFKRRDNTNLMEITLYKDNGETITPNPDHQWSGKALKFGDGDKRLDQELAVTLDGDKIGVPSKQLETLPSGDYGLELWEVNNDNKTIYPSAGFVEFHIHRNADESLESVTPTIDIDKVIDDLHQAGLNVVVDGIEMLAPDDTPSVTSEVRDGKNHIKLHIPRGSKGEQGDPGPAPTLKIGTVTKLNPDQTPTVNLSGGNGSYTLDMGIPQGQTGTVDNAGLTNAPAFQALQTQVNDSAVGTNLFTNSKTMQSGWTGDGTSLSKVDDYLVVSTNSDGKRIYQDPSEKTNGKLMSLSFDAEVPADSKNQSVQIKVGPVDAGVDITISGNDFKRYKVENWVWNGASKAFSIVLKNANDKINIKKIKLEFGAVATPWSPAPAEIMTQADYAKIKAAIVALGGSLS
ncbi:hypothetical protein AXJ17_gp25 [Lactobacillus phage LfeSau]|uniref:hypothetical protein n=1 Tax=Lactobacillus phage LfeSau TaxID=1567453 RepID=UPI0005409E72|nr:hypothetical protein AXJ17_gp25 [Lactobacillus phage LfeSau]AIY32274.1 hypothetical protein LfeSau_25 [Lactobacillus phage LfeSau]